MEKFKVKVKTGAGHADEASAADDADDIEGQGGDELVATAVTVGIVVIGAAIIEAALVPGIIIGVAAAWAPKYFPKWGERLEPLFHSTVRGAYKLGRKARSTVGEVQERMHDIAAEVNAEEVGKATAPPG